MCSLLGANPVQRRYVAIFVLVVAEPLGVVAFVFAYVDAHNDDTPYYTRVPELCGMGVAFVCVPLLCCAAIFRSTMGRLRTETPIVTTHRDMQGDVEMTSVHTVHADFQDAY